MRGCSNPFPWLCSLHSPGLGSGNRCRPGQWQRQWPPCWAVPGPGQAEVEPWSPLAPGQPAGGPAWPCPCPAWGHRSCPNGTGAGRRRGTGSLPEPLPGFGRAWLRGCGGRGRSWGWALLAWPRRGFAFHHRAKTGPCLHLGWAAPALSGWTRAGASSLRALGRFSLIQQDLSKFNCPGVSAGG